MLQPGQLQPDWSDKVTVACSVPPPLASPHVTDLDQSYPCPMSNIQILRDGGMEDAAMVSFNMSFV